MRGAQQAHAVAVDPVRVPVFVRHDAHLVHDAVALPVIGFARTWIFEVAVRVGDCGD